MDDNLQTSAERIATALRRFRTMADMLEHLAAQPDANQDAAEAYEHAARSIRDALAGRTPYCLTTTFCSERGL